MLIDRLAADLAAFERFAPPGGGSNNWAISGSRTLSGKPLLASDPHLAPHIPPAWYLAHVRTPRWAAAGATFAGAPGFPIGHNGHACWGVTAGLTDTTDLVLETLGPDGRTVKQPDGTFAPCEVVREVIRVKGRADVVEEIPVTPRGPVVSPMFPGLTEAVSLRASWLDPRPLRGFMDTHMARDFETFRRCFEKWPVLPLNVVYADAGGTVGWQLVGDVPRRQSGANGTIPLPADAPGNAWDGVIPFDEMPFAANPAEGFIATANNPPGAGPFVGTDFVDGYRAKVIREELAKHPVGWTVADCMKLQQNLRSAPWAEMRDIVLSIGEGSRSEERGSSEDARVGLDLLRGWDGVVAADSPAAAVYELLVAELCLRVAKAHAPKSWAAMVGGDGAGPLTHNLFGDRRVGHLVRLLKGGRGKAEGGSDWSSPPSPFRLPPSSVADALGAVVRYLKRKHGPGPAWWHWGDIRPLVLEHPVFGKQRGLKHIFNRGPFPVGGDQNTVSQAGTRPAQPTAPTHNMAGLRAVFDPADWENCRFVLAGGQSGNPTDRHYDDLLAVWRAGGGVPIPWSPEAVLRASVAALRLTPDSD